MATRQSRGLTKVGVGFPLPHLAGNMEGSRSAQLAAAVFVVTGWPDFLGLFSKGFGNPFFSLREAANHGNR